MDSVKDKASNFHGALVVIITLTRINFCTRLIEGDD